jgi:two-component system, LytTR family, response regulator
MRAIIIDDEKSGAEVLQLLIQQNCEAVSVVAVFYTPEDGIQGILDWQPDVVFLDIEMPTATGFDVVEATKHLHYELVFTTAYEHYAIKALKLNAVDYLLKPIDVDELVVAMNNVKAKINNKQSALSHSQLELLLRQINYAPKKMAIPTNDGILITDTKDIVKMASDSNYTNVFLKNGQKILVSKTLKALEEQLNSTDFIRVHSAHLVNINEIDRYIRGDGGNLILKDKTSIPVSRAHKQELLDRLGL